MTGLRRRLFGSGPWLVWLGLALVLLTSRLVLAGPWSLLLSWRVTGEQSLTLRQTTPVIPVLGNETAIPSASPSATRVVATTSRAVAASVSVTSNRTATAVVSRVAPSSPLANVSIISVRANATGTITPTTSPTGTPTPTPTSTPSPSPSPSATATATPVAATPTPSVGPAATPHFHSPANNTGVLNVLANSGNVSFGLYQDAAFQATFTEILVSNLQSQCVRCENASSIQLTMFQPQAGYFISGDGHTSASANSSSNVASSSNSSDSGPTTAPVLTTRRRLASWLIRWRIRQQPETSNRLCPKLSLNLRQSSTGQASDSSTTQVAVALQISADPADIPTVQNRTTSGLLSAVLATASNTTDATMQVVSRTAAFGSGAQDPFNVPVSSSTSSPSTGLIAGVVVGTIAGVLLAAIFGFLLWRRCRRQRAKQEAQRTKEAAEAAARKYREQQSAMAAAAAAQRLTSGSGRPIPPPLPQDGEATGDALSRARYAGVVTLRELARARILQGMMRIVRAAEAEANASSAALHEANRKMVFLIIADRRSLAVLSAACRLTDLIQEGAFPLPRMSAVYFVSPQLASFERLVADFPDVPTGMYPSMTRDRSGETNGFATLSNATTTMSGAQRQAGSSGRAQSGSGVLRTPRGRRTGAPSTTLASNASTFPGPRYRAAHVFTTARVSDELLNLLRQSSSLVQRLLTFTELNLDFMAIEERIFSLDYTDALQALFHPTAVAADLDERVSLAPSWEPLPTPTPQQDRRELIHTVAQNLLTLCHLIGEVPTIRYQRSESGVAQAIAEALVDTIKDYEANVPGGMRGAQLQADALQTPVDGASSSKSTPVMPTMLLILDRSIDMVAPFLHEYTYQAMCNDLLSADALGQRHHSVFLHVTREAFLDEYADSTWARLRHLHIADAISEISDELQSNSLNALRSTLDSAPSSRHPTASTSSSRSSTISYDQMQKLSKYAVHMDILDCLMHRFNDRYLQRTSLCEQDLADGLVDCHGNVISTTEAAQRTALILQDQHVPLEDKVRLLAIVLVTMDVSARDVDDLLDAMEDVGLGREVKPGERQALAERALRYFRASRGESYDLSRYVPFVREVLEAVARNRLSRSRFPVLLSDEPEQSERNQPRDRTPRSRSRSLSRERETAGRAGARYRAASVRRRRSSSVVRRRSDSVDDLERGSGRELSSASEDDGLPNGTERIPESKRPRRRVIVFIAGGMCASEMRVAYEVSADLPLNVYLGATHVLTPARMLEALREISQHVYAGETSRAWRPGSSTEHRRRGTAAASTLTSSRPSRLLDGAVSAAGPGVSASGETIATQAEASEGSVPRRRRSSSLSRFFSRR
ncbi:syntaxin binding protein [Cyanidiococcus yangmingshanensis]|uniref:Syntaxin binding protein n=1 Tax=Cyanidiococcus yangmingshanensis TaxID=2690220 RepID=A0A7J7IGW5_9RHOD|nr:syntaxin binding protein [Cyanidiococcus yangmingshanensis]